MFRSRWLAGLALSSLVVLVACQKGPFLSQVSPAPEFTLMLSAPERYRGNAALSMRFSSPAHEAFAVSAIPAQVARIDVVLWPGGSGNGTGSVTGSVTGGVTAGAPPAPASMPHQPAPGMPVMVPDSVKAAIYGFPRHGQPPVPAMPMPAIRDGSLGKPLVGPDGTPPNAVMQASLTKDQLDIGQGEIVIHSLKAGSYGVTMTAYGSEGQVIGQSHHSTQVVDGKTTSLDAPTVISWSSGSGASGNANSANSAGIVTHGPTPSEGVIKGVIGEAEASASHGYVTGRITE